jgi:hypothetical protein
MPAGNTEGEPKPEDKKIVTLEEYIAAAPAQIQDVLHNSMTVHNEEKKRLVDLILANKRNPFTKADLDNRPLGELKNIAALAATEANPATTRTANYSGQAPAPVGNEAEEVLEIPVLNFSPAK